MIKEKTTLVNAFITVADIAVALISFNLALYIEFKEFPVLIKDSIILQLLIVMLWGVLVGIFGLNTLYRSRPYSVVLINCFAVSLVGTSLLVVSTMIFNLYYIGITPLIFFVGISIVFTFGFKLLIFKIFKTVRKRGYNFLNILVIGDSTALSFLRLIDTHPEWGYRITAVIGSETIVKEFGNKFLFLPTDTAVEQLMRDKTIDQIVFCKKEMNQKEIEELVQICSEMGVVFRLYSPFINMLTHNVRLNYFGIMPLLTIFNTPSDYISLMVKKIFDYLFSFIALVIALPILLIISLLIKIDSEGPVFFKQKRVGLRGRRFTVYKFRTMIKEAEKLKSELVEQNEMDGPVFKIANDPRITKIGRFLRKTSLDEVPQFFNVLKGDMSIVGPRPPIPEEVKQYERWQLRRLSMKPGITCIWQVSGRNNIPFDEWMKMDMEYIDNWSLKLDAIILLKTVRAVIRRDGE